MIITRHRTFFFWVTGLLLAGAIGTIVYFGLPLGIDFTGGSLMQVSYPDGRPAVAVVQEQVASAGLDEVSVRESGAGAFSIRTRTMTPEEHDAVLAALQKQGKVVELSYTSVGPSLGSQFANKSLWAILAVALVIALYVAFAFRKVSRPVPSWIYGVIVILMLAHDLIIPMGFYALLSHYTGVAVDALFVTALLALLGYSVNDTIVVFDRIREHLAHNEKTNTKEAFEDTVGKSVSETFTRSINTSLTTALALTALVFFGAAATRDFALVMLVGVIAGTYSSVFIAAPLLIPIGRWYVGRTPKK